VKNQLSAKFEKNDIGATNLILGIEIKNRSGKEEIIVKPMEEC